VQKRVNRWRCRLGIWTHVGPRNHVLDGAKFRRIQSEPQVVTTRRCGLLSNYFAHSLRLLLLSSLTCLIFQFQRRACLSPHEAVHRAVRLSLVLSLNALSQSTTFPIPSAILTIVNSCLPACFTLLMNLNSCARNAFVRGRAATTAARVTYLLFPILLCFLPLSRNCFCF